MSKRQNVTFEIGSKKKLWKQYGNIATSMTAVSKEESKKLLFQYSRTGAVGKLDVTFLETVMGFMNVGGDDEDENCTPLMSAAKNGHSKVVDQLVKVGKSDVNKKAAWNESTALMIAAERGHAEVVDHLIALNADINLCNSFQNTALMLAAELGNRSVMEVLLRQYDSIQMDTKNGYENTALFLAASNGHKECVDLLISSGADMNIGNKFGKTALMVAAENGYYDIVRCLISVTDLRSQRAADINQVSKRGLSALMLAAARGFADIVKLLTHYGADIHEENKDRTDNVLTYACFGGSSEIIVHLINLGADVNYQNINEDSVLMRACEHGNEATMGMLLSNYSSHQVLTALTVQNKEGLTCLMKACRTGNLNVIVFLLDLLKSQLSATSVDGNVVLDDPHSGSSPTRRNSQSSDNDSTKEGEGDHKAPSSSSATPSRPSMSKCIIDGDSSVAGVFQAYYGSLENHDGETAATLLFDYFLNETDAFVEFVMKATLTYDKMYLLDLLPFHVMIPKFDNPSTVLNAFMGSLYGNLSGQRGFKADVKLVHVLVDLAATLQLVSVDHPRETDIQHMLEGVEEALRQCMNSNSMDVPVNVTLVLSAHPDRAENEALIVQQAMAWSEGPLKLCLQHDITGLLGTAPISNHIRSVFWASLKTTKTCIIRKFSDLFQVRSGCLTFRYRPVFMFCFECAMSVIYLALVASVSAETGGEAASVGVCGAQTWPASAVCLDPLGSSGSGSGIGSSSAVAWLSCKETLIVVMLISSVMYDIGDVLDRGSLDKLYFHVWDMVDMLRNTLVGLWLVYRLFAPVPGAGRGLLAISAVPMSIGLLRFLSIFRSLGRLVVMIFGMYQELISFLVVFLMSILGFGIAFHSLFPDLEGFKTSGATVLTLFDAALGVHEFQPFQGHKYQDLGTAAMTVYIVFAVIILLNLIIARMSAVHEKMDEKSFELWSMVMAKTAEDFLLLKEKWTPLCMLPPPLNLISTAMFPWDMAERRRQDRDDIPSVCGTVSDHVIVLVTAPLCAAFEVVLVNEEVWRLPIPRHNALLVSVASVLLFPLWYSLFLALILASAWENVGKMTHYSRRTKRILYSDGTGTGPSSAPGWVAYLEKAFFAPPATEPPPVDAPQVPLATPLASLKENEGARQEAEDGAGAGVAVGLTGSIMHLFFSRLSWKGKVGFLGRKPNLYLKVTYGYDYEIMPLFKRGWNAGNNWSLNFEMTFALTEAKGLLIEVFDKDAADMQWSNPCVLVAYARLDIREWIANRSFEGECKFLVPRSHLPTDDRLQLVARIGNALRATSDEEPSRRSSAAAAAMATAAATAAALKNATSAAARSAAVRTASAATTAASAATTAATSASALAASSATAFTSSAFHILKTTASYTSLLPFRTPLDHMSRSRGLSSSRQHDLRTAFLIDSDSGPATPTPPTRTVTFDGATGTDTTAVASASTDESAVEEEEDEDEGCLFTPEDRARIFTALCGQTPEPPRGGALESAPTDAPSASAGEASALAPGAALIPTLLRRTSFTGSNSAPTNHPAYPTPTPPHPSEGVRDLRQPDLRNSSAPPHLADVAKALQELNQKVDAVNRQVSLLIGTDLTARR